MSNFELSDGIFVFCFGYFFCVEVLFELFEFSIIDLLLRYDAVLLSDLESLLFGLLLEVAECLLVFLFGEAPVGVIFFYFFFSVIDLLLEVDQVVFLEYGGFLLLCFLLGVRFYLFFCLGVRSGDSRFVFSSFSGIVDGGLVVGFECCELDVVFELLSLFVVQSFFFERVEYLIEFLLCFEFFFAESLSCLQFVVLLCDDESCFFVFVFDPYVFCQLRIFLLYSEYLCCVCDLQCEGFVIVLFLCDLACDELLFEQVEFLVVGLLQVVDFLFSTVAKCRFVLFSGLFGCFFVFEGVFEELFSFFECCDLSVYFFECGDVSDFDGESFGLECLYFLCDVFDCLCDGTFFIVVGSRVAAEFFCEIFVNVVDGRFDVFNFLLTSSS